MLPPSMVELSPARELDTAVMLVEESAARTTSSAALAVSAVVPVIVVAEVSAVTEPFDVRLIISTFEIEDPAGDNEVISAVVVMFRVSVPAAPSMASRAVSVWTPAAVLPVKVSSPAPRVELSIFAVSVQVEF